jgi:quercetin dioxygenase-like cupin family protein
MAAPTLAGALSHRPAGTGAMFWGPGDMYRFLVTGEQTAGAYFVMEAVVPPGGGPPPHIHRNEDETLYVVAGRCDFLLGDERITAGPGDFVNVPRGAVHCFHNASDAEVRSSSPSRPPTSRASSRTRASACWTRTRRRPTTSTRSSPATSRRRRATASSSSNVRPMVTWEDVVAIGSRFPDVEVGTSFGTPALKVGGKGLICRLRTAPDALVLRVIDLADREALLLGRPDVFFTTPHYDGYPYVLVRLDVVGETELAELIEDAWRLRAPKRVVAAHDAAQR